MKRSVSELDRFRAQYAPRLPRVLAEGAFQIVRESAASPDLPAQVIAEFPHSISQPVVRIDPGQSSPDGGPVTVGVVFSGGQAPGGHNVVAGLFDALKKANPSSRLIGFLGGPRGVIRSEFKEITADLVDQYRNTGGFDMIGSGRDKIEKAKDLAACGQTLTGLGASGLVVIGGDDSNTNAAVLAEYFLANNIGVSVIGVPKTIDGDLKTDLIETSFGFDTAAKVFSELVGSISRDAMSACKYWHFIRLMGRAASHVALEVALQTRPSLAIISEEVEARQTTLSQVVDQIADVVCRRAAAGKGYGVVLIPEGLLEFLADVKQMIQELSTVLGSEEKHVFALPDHAARVGFLSSKLSPPSAQVYAALPEGIQQVLLMRDKHGNVPLSQVETEKLLIELVQKKIASLKKSGEFKGSFSPLGHFFGYEGRCVQPSNFDSNYCYALGYTAVQLLREHLTGYTVSARALAGAAEDWVMGGVPVTSMLTIEMRKGEPKAVIKKTLVDLDGPVFRAFADARGSWVLDDAFQFPGPIQYFGPPEVCDGLTLTLQLEYGAAAGKQEAVAAGVSGR